MSSTLLSCLFSQTALSELQSILQQTYSSKIAQNALIFGPPASGKQSLVKYAVESFRQEKQDDTDITNINLIEIDCNFYQGIYSSNTIDINVLKYIVSQIDSDPDPNPTTSNTDTDTDFSLDTSKKLLVKKQNKKIPLKSLLSNWQKLLPLDQLTVIALYSIDILATMNTSQTTKNTKKQSLLYSLFNVTSSSSLPLIVLGTTQRFLLPSLFEKRVSSRFSSRIITLSYPLFTLVKFQQLFISFFLLYFDIVLPRRVFQFKEQFTLIIPQIFKMYRKHVFVDDLPITLDLSEKETKSHSFRSSVFHVKRNLVIMMDQLLTIVLHSSSKKPKILTWDLIRKNLSHITPKLVKQSLKSNFAQQINSRSVILDCQWSWLTPIGKLLLLCCARFSSLFSSRDWSLEQVFLLYESLGRKENQKMCHWVWLNQLSGEWIVPITSNNTSTASPFRFARNIWICDLKSLFEKTYNLPATAKSWISSLSEWD